jgi:hypothetical protein
MEFVENDEQYFIGQVKEIAMIVIGNVHVYF